MMTTFAVACPDSLMSVVCGQCEAVVDEEICKFWCSQVNASQSAWCWAVDSQSLVS